MKRGVSPTRVAVPPKKKLRSLDDRMSALFKERGDNQAFLVTIIAPPTKTPGAPVLLQKCNGESTEDKAIPVFEKDPVLVRPCAYGSCPGSTMLNAVLQGIPSEVTDNWTVRVSCLTPTDDGAHGLYPNEKLSRTHSSLLEGKEEEDFAELKKSTYESASNIMNWGWNALYQKLVSVPVLLQAWSTAFEKKPATYFSHGWINEKKMQEKKATDVFVLSSRQEVDAWLEAVSEQQRQIRHTFKL